MSRSQSRWHSGWVAAGGWLFYTAATITYAILCERSLRQFLYLLPIWLATRR